MLQGERSMATDNKSLSRFILDGILPAPRGLPQIEVEFNIDANGIVTVSARDQATGKQQHVTIQPSSGLSDEEVERLRGEAEVHAEEDLEKRRSVETRNAADTLAYTAEKRSTRTRTRSTTISSRASSPRSRTFARRWRAMIWTRSPRPPTPCRRRCRRSVGPYTAPPAGPTAAGAKANRSPRTRAKPPVPWKASSARSERSRRGDVTCSLVTLCG